ncbi:MAG: hypothetical protein P4L77_11855 [Sulfuriferula sp.]|nr:hypothetical protein [Sulfuriferula sp.]
MNTNIWQISGIAEVGYKVGNDDTVEHVAMQLVQCKIRIPQELGTDVTEKVQLACLDQAEQWFKKKLGRSDVNYGIVGLKRWHVQFRHINCQSILNPEVAEAEENIDGSAS